MQIRLFSNDDECANLHLIQIEPMLAQEMDSLELNYSYEQTAFGIILIASSARGICYLAFVDDEQNALSDLKSTYPKAHLSLEHKEIHLMAARFLLEKGGDTELIVLHCKGTEFQLNVWTELLKIPFGSTLTYSQLAERIGLTPKASRAVGTAVGSNNVAFLIPCHRVVQASGALGGYKWGLERKKAILAWERA